MTHLRQMMFEELEHRNFAETTKQCYIQAVEEFAGYFHCPPDQLGPEHIREFQAHLFTKRKLAPNTVNQRLAALRFFFVKTLRRPWNAAETPYPKKVIHLPIVLSQEEVVRLIDAAVLPFHRVILMTLYSTGVRRAELAHRIRPANPSRACVHTYRG
jgi:integrase/recombinase XerD